MADRFVKVGNINVRVLYGDLTKQSTDVIINSSVTDLDLSKGRASKALLEAAGDDIQLECSIDYPSGITPEDVAITGPGDLNCQNIYHVALPKYKNVGDEKKLDVIVGKCLEEASDGILTSLSFPALGTGFLNYPIKVVVQTFFSSIENFSKKKPNSSVQNINIVIYKDNKETFEEFLQEARRRATNKVAAAPPVNHPPFSSKVGHATVTVSVGSIVEEKVDAIVCCGPLNMKLNRSQGLPKTINQSAGTQLQAEIDAKYPNGLKSGEIAVLSGHSLKCQKILYGHLTPFYAKKVNGYLPEQVLDHFVKKCLEKASELSLKSLAIPALGTGHLKFPAGVAAKTVVNALKDFLGSRARCSLTSIKIVVFGGTGEWQAIHKAYEDCLSSTSIPTKVLEAPRSVPQRGTKAYLSYVYTAEPKTPSYWTQFHSKKTIKDWNTSTPGSPFHVVDVDSKTRSSISNAFLKTCSGVNIISVERIENIHLYEKYSQECLRLFRKAFVSDTFIPLESVPTSRGPACSHQHLDQAMVGQLHSEINELYLFHGTKVSFADVIVQQGLDKRLASSGLLGTGVYTAEMADKSHGYTDASSSGERKMFLMRVCLGDIFMVASPKPYRQPPCRTCMTDTCNDHPEQFDSIVAEFNKREFVVYDSSKCYPEYVITYRK